MSAFVIILVIAAVLSIQTVRLVIHDGRGPAQPPRSHFDDPRFTSPSSGR